MRLGVDIGGTKLLGALVDGPEVVASKKRSTPRGGPAALCAAVAEILDALDPDHAIGSVGVGIPGHVRSADGVVESSPNLVGFSDGAVAVGALLADAVGRAVVIDNDVNAAALAEHRHGAGRGVADLLGLFVGTGVGGGLILDGQLRRGPRGLAGEIGHSVVAHRHGVECGCGQVGHLEAYAGRASLERRARAEAADGSDSALVELAGEKRMKSSVWEKALAADDPLATRLIEEAHDALVAAVVSVVVVVDIERVVLGGGLGHRLGEPLRRRLEDGANESIFGDASIDVRWAELGDEAGVIGAAHLVA